MLKINLLFKKFTNFTGANDLSVLGNKKAKLSDYCFYMNTVFRVIFKSELVYF